MSNPIMQNINGCAKIDLLLNNYEYSNEHKLELRK